MSGTGLDDAMIAGELALRLRQQELVAAFGLFALREDRLDATLHEACATAVRGLEARFSKVLVFRPETQDLLIAYGTGWAEGVVGNVVLGADLASPAGYALRTKQPVVSNHLAQEGRFRTPAVLAETRHPPRGQRHHRWREWPALWRAGGRQHRPAGFHRA